MASTFKSAGMYIRVTTNKVFEIESYLYKYPTQWFRVCTQLTRKTSNPGFSIYLSLLWVSIEISFYDRRGWDYNNNTYKEEDPKEDESVKFKYF